MTPPVWTTVREMRSAVSALHAAAERVVLVPTMGDLHAGHLELVKAGLPFGRVVVTVFVNPTQFAPGEDYDRYPRRLAADIELLAPLGIEAVFAPAAQEMYPEGERTRVEVSGLSDPLCGAHRTGHFRGVTTICTKLFVASACDLAVFGQKDAQQCLLIHRLVQDLTLPVDLLFVPTDREASGLARSSRNRYLEGEDRDRATALSRALRVGRDLLAAGERSVQKVEAAVHAELVRVGVRPDYAELRTVPDLEHPEQAAGRMLLAVGAYVGRARLIDNLCLEIGEGVRDVPLFDHHTASAIAARWSPQSRSDAP